MTVEVNNPTDNLYDVMGVSPDCDFAGLKRAYYACAKRCHPDKFANSPEKTEEFKLLITAFATLSDPEKRAVYDSMHRRKHGHTTHHGKKSDGVISVILDSEADDILEELIVGNDVPPESSLETLLQDLTKTEIYMSYLEGRNALAGGNPAAAEPLFNYVVGRAPGNILFRIYLARTQGKLRKYRPALYHYQVAIGLGRQRIPPQSMFNVSVEYESLKTRSNPLRMLYAKLFAPKKFNFCDDAAATLVEELNGSIARQLAREENAEQNKLN